MCKQTYCQRSLVAWLCMLSVADDALPCLAPAKEPATRPPGWRSARLPLSRRP